MVAVTGPLASGKSTFVEMLGKLPGVETVSADETVHHLLARDEETITCVIGRFGEDVRDEEGIDRKALAGKVFGDAKALKDLEEILHPRVREETSRRAASSGAEVFVTEIPLLFEDGGTEQFDLTVAVVTPDERRKRWVEERGMGEEQRRAIEARQLDGEEKARRADVAVENDGDLDNMKKQAVDLVERLLGEELPGGGSKGPRENS
jgi:dephospho-CoA kinase